MWVAAPLALPGLPSRWMLIVTLDEAEPRHELLAWRRIMWINTLVLMLVVGIAGAWLAHRIRHPIRRTMAILSASSTQIAAASNEQDRTTGQQLAALSEIVTTLEELAASARHSSEQGLLAAQRAAQGIQVSNDSAGTIQQLLGQMTTIRDKVQDIAQRILTLSEQTAQIREIAAAMTDFASETRMLSMNAAVEAVHAGEKGRGFAILAMETRKLAEESRLSARRIATLTDEIEQVMSSAVMVTDDGGKAADAGREQALHTTALMHEAATLMRDNAGSVQQIHRNIDQQSLAIQQLRDAIQSIHQGSREGVQGIAQIKNGLGALNQMLIHMKEIV
jgi:methyl-accepting chemotaxis protein